MFRLLSWGAKRQEELHFPVWAMSKKTTLSGGKRMTSIWNKPDYNFRFGLLYGTSY